MNLEPVRADWRFEPASSGRACHGTEEAEACGVKQALIETIHRQAGRIPIPVIIAALLICSLAAGRAPTPLVAAWAGLILVVQAVRVVSIRSMILPSDCPPGRRIRYWTGLSAINGVAVAASVCFSPYLNDVERSAHSMVLIGLTAGSVAISHGYAPMFIAYAGPILVGLILSWALVPGELGPLTRSFIVVLIGLLGLVMRDLARDAFTAFAQNIRINAALQRALQAEQFANNAKTRFLAAASHDLRQPLHTLSLLSAALAMRPLDDKSARIARSMNEAMSDLSSELDSLLDISKLDAGVVHVEHEPIDLVPMVSRIVASMVDQATRKQLALVTGPLTQTCVRSDRALLERVLRNLIDNAIKYTVAGSIVVSVQSADGRCVIEVRDTGTGIAEADQDRIFDEFYQVGNVERDRRKGLGLGLSIVRRLAALLDGRVTVESTPGQGSCFRVWLAAIEPQRSAVRIRPSVAPQALAGLRILLLEDDIAVRAATRVLLEELECSVLEAGTAREAIEIASASELDLILADIRLPGAENGLAAIVRLRQIHPSIATLLVSGETESARLLEADRMGLTHLVKPVDQATLVSAILRELR